MIIGDKKNQTDYLLSFQGQITESSFKAYAL